MILASITWDLTLVNKNKQIKERDKESGTSIVYEVIGYSSYLNDCIRSYWSHLVGSGPCSLDFALTFSLDIWHILGSVQRQELQRRRLGPSNDVACFHLFFWTSNTMLTACPNQPNDPKVDKKQ